MTETVTTGERPPAADVYVGAGEAAGAESLLVDSLAAFGFTVRVRVWPTSRAVGELHWLLLVALPLQAFLSGVGEDLYRKLKEAVRGTLVRQREQDPGRSVVLQDTETGVRILLGADLDEEAFARLGALDWSRLRHVTLRYDATEARWSAVPEETDA